MKEACRHPEIDPEQFKASLQEVTSLREQLGAAEREKNKVEQEWRRRLEESEKHKTEEINELKVIIFRLSAKVELFVRKKKNRFGIDVVSRVGRSSLLCPTDYGNYSLYVSEFWVLS